MMMILLFRTYSRSGILVMLVFLMVVIISIEEKNRDVIRYFSFRVADN